MSFANVGILAACIWGVHVGDYRCKKPTLYIRHMS